MGNSIVGSDALYDVWYFLVVSWDETATFSQFTEQDHKVVIRDVETVLEELDLKRFVERLWKYHVKQNWSKLAERVYEQCLLILSVIYEAKKSCYEARIQAHGDATEDSKVVHSEITTNYHAMKARARNAYDLLLKKQPDDEILPKLRRKNVLGPTEPVNADAFAEYWVEHYVTLFHECWLASIRAHADASRSQARTKRGALRSSTTEDDVLTDYVDDTTDWTVNVNAAGLNLTHFLRFSTQDNIRVPLRLRAVQSALAAASLKKATQLRDESEDARAAKLGKLGQSVLGSSGSDEPTSGATSSQLAQLTKQRKEQEAAALNHPNFLIENPDDLFIIVCASVAKDRPEIWVVTDPVPISSDVSFSHPLNFTYAPPHKPGTSQLAAVPSILDAAFSTNGRAQGPTHAASHPVVSTAIPNVPQPPPTISSTGTNATASSSVVASREGWLSSHAYKRLQTVSLGVYVVKIAHADGGDSDFEVLGALGVCPPVRLIEIVEAARAHANIVVPIQQFVTADKISPHFSPARLELSPRLLEVEGEEIRGYQRSNRWDLTAYRKCEQRIREAVRRTAKEQQRALIFSQMPPSARQMYTRARNPERALLSLKRNDMHELLADFREFLASVDDDAEIQSEEVTRLHPGEDHSVHLANKDGRLISGVSREPAEDCTALPVVITAIGAKVLRPAYEASAKPSKDKTKKPEGEKTKPGKSGGLLGFLPFSPDAEEGALNSPALIYNQIVSTTAIDEPINIHAMSNAEQEKLLNEFERILESQIPEVQQDTYPAHLMDEDSQEEKDEGEKSYSKFENAGSSHDTTAPTAQTVKSHAGHSTTKHGAVARRSYGHSRTGLGNGFMGAQIEDNSQCLIA